MDARQGGWEAIMHARSTLARHAAKQKPEANRLRGIYDSERNITQSVTPTTTP